MSYSKDETSVENSQPIELYIFKYNEVVYGYTSSQYICRYNIDNTDYEFNPEYIKRGDSLKLGDSGGSVETCIITVPRTNNVALLYQGSPPELSQIQVSVYRVHGKPGNEVIRILDGVVSQVMFKGSEADLTITIENVLGRYIPRGTLSYSCQNCIYDSKCGLNKESFAKVYDVVGEIKNLTIYSHALGSMPEDYYTDGYLVMGNCARAIVKHKSNYVKIKYPINEADMLGYFTIYPGCSSLFLNCHRRFNNTDNFNGIPYIQPYDAFRHPVGHGAYWLDSKVIVRDSKMAIHKMNL